MFISLFLIALQDPAAPAEPEPLTREVIEAQIQQVSELFNMAGSRLEDFLEDVGGLSVPVVESTEEQAGAEQVESRLRDAVQASERLVAEMEELLKILPD